MKKLDEINQTLDLFHSKYGIDVKTAQQGSGIWMTAKLGVVSASNACRAVAKVGSETRATYMAELVAQVCTGVFEEVNTKYMEWGKQHEDAARSCYEFASGNKTTQLPFVFKDGSFREGCSPDSMISDTHGAEIKCPYNSVHYIKFLTDKIKPEYVWQYQYTMRVMEADRWDFTQYDPRMKKSPIHTVTMKIDPEKQKTFDDLLPAFIEGMDEMLAVIGVRFGDQWVSNE